MTNWTEIKHKNPWTTLSSREVYKNEWIRLREDQVITPAGNKGIYGVVETKPAIGVIPLTADLQTYLVGQYRYTLDFYSWEIPEGGGMEGESVLDGAKRELQEETGLVAGKWSDLGTCHTSNSIMNETAYIFLAEELSKGPSRPDSTEDLLIKRLPFSEAWQMALNGKIQDAIAIIGLMRAREFLKRQGRI